MGGDDLIDDLLRALHVDDEQPCRLDRYGICQVHDRDGIDCRVERARLVAQGEPARG